MSTTQTPSPSIDDTPLCQSDLLPEQPSVVIDSIDEGGLKQYIEDFTTRDMVPCHVNSFTDGQNVKFSVVFCSVNDPSQYTFLYAVSKRNLSKTSKAIRDTHSLQTLACYDNVRGKLRCAAVLGPTQKLTKFSIAMPYGNYQIQLLKRRKSKLAVFSRKVYVKKSANDLLVDVVYQRQSFSTSLQDLLTLNQLVRLVEANKQRGFYLADGNSRLHYGDVVYSALFTTQKYGKCNYKVLYNLSVGELYDVTIDLSKHGYHIKVIIPTTGQARTLYIAVFWH